MSRKLFFGIVASLVCLSTVYAGKSIVVDLSQQRAIAYENGTPVFSGQISTGTAKRPTPTGSFRVLEKDVDHVSTSWPKPNGGAKMHYMLRVTSYGIAMHLGFVPNYPASHGCIRMQNGFAQRMYRWAHVGVPIRIIGHAPARVYRNIAKRTIPKKKETRKRLTALGIFSSSSKIDTVTMPKNRTVTTRKIQISPPAKKSSKTVSYRAPSALDALSASPKISRKVATPQKKEKIVKAKQALRKALPYHAPSTLDVLSTSPKTAERVERAQKVKWKNRPKRKAPKVDPLKAIRA